VGDERAGFGDREQVRELVRFGGVEVSLIAEVTEARRGYPAQGFPGAETKPDIGSLRKTVSRQWASRVPGPPVFSTGT
jgi:hypothetical protein